MTRFRRRIRSFAWLALVAMAALAFGPTVSRTLGVEAMAGGAITAHCMAMGSGDATAMPASMSMSMSMSMAMPADGHGGPPGAPVPSHHRSNLLDCCALCTIAASPMAIVSFALPPWQPVVVAALAPASASAAAPQQRLQWPSAAPRGPPSLS